MKILFFADTHGDRKALTNLKNKAKEADHVVCLGDFTIMESEIDEVMKQLNEFNKPVLLIHGNHEDDFRVRDLAENYQNITFLHKGAYELENHLFLGYGGDGFSTNDPEFENVAEKFFKKEIKENKKIIFLTHGPPHGTEIDKINGAHSGNKSYRKFIDEVKPHLAISGHLHENAGKHQKIGRTFILNPGKNGAIINI